MDNAYNMLLGQNWVFVTGAVLLAGTLIALSSMYLIGYFRPAWLYSFFNKLAGPITAVTTKVSATMASCHS